MTHLHHSLRSALLWVFALLPMSLFAQQEWKQYAQEVNFIVANDLGRNGYYEQRPFAQLMGQVAEAVGIEAVVAPGDIHHFEGVASVHDPLWQTNFELIYSHPELMVPWYVVMGNHEYRGNTQAVLDYTRVSRRWIIPSRYYTKVVRNDGVSVRLVMLDTAPIIERYRNNPDTYPDARLQNVEKQMAWLDSVLTVANEDWVVVLGHHPIFAHTPKAESERDDMQRVLLPVLRKHKNVALYICGHIHNFQHIRKKDDSVDYVVNSAAALSRPKVQAVDGTVFCSGEPGFSLLTAGAHNLSLRMMNRQGSVLHTITRNKP